MNVQDAKLGILNLNPEFTPFKEMLEFPECQELGVEVFSFPSGCEPHLKISDVANLAKMEDILITAKIKSSDDVFRLLFAIDIIRHNDLAERIALFIPYLPFARQDRYTTPNDPFSLKVFAELINQQNLDFIILFDAHSSVSTELLKKSYDIKNTKFAWDSFTKFCEETGSAASDICIVSPDKGAAQKIDSVVEFINSKSELSKAGVSYCTKVRNPNTGALSDPQCDIEDYQGKNILIIDDICDGGYTFIQLAKELKKRNVGKIALAVSHGIFSKGFEPFRGIIDRIYTTDSLWSDTGNSDPILSVYPLNAFYKAKCISEDRLEIAYLATSEKELS